VSRLAACSFRCLHRFLAEQACLSASTWRHVFFFYFLFLKKKKYFYFIFVTPTLSQTGIWSVNVRAVFRQFSLNLAGSATKSLSSSLLPLAVSQIR
jgi:hypothetical protein